MSRFCSSWYLVGVAVWLLIRSGQLAKARSALAAEGTHWSGVWRRGAWAMCDGGAGGYAEHAERDARS